jgi:hypothetical protein
MNVKHMSIKLLKIFVSRYLIKISGMRDRGETTGEDFGWSGKMSGGEVNHKSQK